MSHRTRERLAECLASLSHSTMIGLPRAQPRELVHSLQMYCVIDPSEVPPTPTKAGIAHVGAGPGIRRSALASDGRGFRGSPPCPPALCRENRASRVWRL
ncbi:hypothetical protein EVAR_48792_1 [Eumeta japonica]|uniref:Uncharacterized protein n=1 Tax=Eumeta variegata TaxID=151549 RepID=A0A4C1Y460_EUMVA|nr:hypothetical protein EVAR_48792_1 [Eumeta japonica]